MAAAVTPPCFGHCPSSRPPCPVRRPPARLPWLPPSAAHSMAADRRRPFHAPRPPPLLCWPPATGWLLHERCRQRDWIAFLFLFSRVFLQNRWTIL